jgi:hypothetical protein
LTTQHISGTILVYQKYGADIVCGIVIGIRKDACSPLVHTMQKT